MNCVKFSALGLALYGLFAIFFIANATPTETPPASQSAGVQAANFKAWLVRMHEAPQKRSYIGTFVVSSAGQISSAKIWHAGEGQQQVERVEILTGTPRAIFRHNELVLTVLPNGKVVRSEKREASALLTDRLQAADSRMTDFYQLRAEGSERVAGVQADVVTLRPKDQLRFGYRVWTEHRDGLMLKLQTLDNEGKVLEQATFSELQLDAPVKIESLLQMMNKTSSYPSEKPLWIKTSKSSHSTEEWPMETTVPGFEPMHCYKQAFYGAATDSGSTENALQCSFSDGLAAVSVFVEPFEPQLHVRESSFSLGATQTLTRRLDKDWVTLVGEVPTATLRLFAAGLSQRKVPKN